MTTAGRLAIAAGLFVLTLLVLWKDWLQGDELFFVGLAVLSGGVFFAAYRISASQIAAASVADLLAARDEIRTLKEQITTLKDEVEAARQAQQEAHERVDDQGLQDVARDATTAVDSSLADASKKVDGLFDTVSGAVEKLPESQRLAGVWVSVGLALALLAFVVATDINISTSSDDTPTATTTTDTTESP